MLQAIQTKYLGPTNYKGSRIVAKASAGKVICNWNHEKSVEENHRLAAQWLMRKLEWVNGKTYLEGVCLPSGDYCFVMVERAK